MPRTPFVTTCALLFGSMLVPAADAVTWGRGGGAASASEFYSRRRVNGAWITGRFAKAEVDAELDRIGRFRRPVRKIVRRVVRKPAAAAPARQAILVAAPPTTAAVSAPAPVATEPNPVAAPAAVPVPQAAGAETVPIPDGRAVAPLPAPDPLPPVAEVAPAQNGVDPDAEHMEKLRLGLQRKALAILAARSDATSDPVPYPDAFSRQEKVESAPPTP